MLIVSLFRIDVLHDFWISQDWFVYLLSFLMLIIFISKFDSLNVIFEMLLRTT